MPTATVDKPHAGRVALVTGAARGIGQAIAVGLADRGATVVLGDLDDLSDTTELIAGTGGSAVAAELDISDPSVVEAVPSIGWARCCPDRSPWSEAGDAASAVPSGYTAQ